MSRSFLNLNKVIVALCVSVCAVFTMSSAAMAQVEGANSSAENMPVDDTVIEGGSERSDARSSTVSERRDLAISERASKSKSTKRIRSKIKKLRREIDQLRSGVGRTENKLQKNLKAVDRNGGKIFRLNGKVREATKKLKKVRKKFNKLPRKERRRASRIRKFDRDVDRLRNEVRNLENRIESITKNTASARKQYRRAYATRAAGLKSRRARLRSKLKEAAKLERQILNSIPNPRKRFGSRWKEPAAFHPLAAFAALQASRRSGEQGTALISDGAGFRGLRSPSSAEKDALKGTANHMLYFFATTCRATARIIWIFQTRAPCAVPSWNDGKGAYEADHAYELPENGPDDRISRQERLIPHRAAFFGDMTVDSTDKIIERRPQEFEHSLQVNNDLVFLTGIQAVEIDLKVFTKDGHLLVSHDRGADRTKPSRASAFLDRPISYYDQIKVTPVGHRPGQFESFSGVTLAEIRRRYNKVLFPAKADEGYMYTQNWLTFPTAASNVHTFQEWIDNYIKVYTGGFEFGAPRRSLAALPVLDIKNSAAMEEAVRIVRKNGMEDHVVFKLPIDVLLRKDLYPDVALERFGLDLWYIIAINGSEFSDGGRYIKECGDRYCLRWGDSKFKDMHVWVDDMHGYSRGDTFTIPKDSFLNAMAFVSNFLSLVSAYFLPQLIEIERVVGFELTPDVSQKLGSSGRVRIERTFDRVFEHMYYWKDMGSTFSYFTTPEYGYTNSTKPGFDINECVLGAASGENLLFQKPLAEFQSERNFAEQAMYPIANIMQVVLKGGSKIKVSTDLIDFARYYCDKG